MQDLQKYKNTLRKWELTDNPFRAVPPDTAEDLEKIFYGRAKEVEIALPTLYEGRNILIRGAWGIGKTSLIQHLLYQLQKQVAALDEPMAVLYLSGIPGDSANDFYRALALMLADSLSEVDKQAKDIANTLRGFSIQRPKQTIEGRVRFFVFTLGARVEKPSSEITPMANADPYTLLIPLLYQAEEHYSRLVIAIDDLDKKNPTTVQEILEKSLDLFRMGRKRSFVMTGRSFTTLQETSIKALGIFSEDFNLSAMSADELHHIVIRYLNSVRETPRDSVYPFTEEVIERIIEYSRGIPRQLNTICEKILRQAAMRGATEIDNEIFSLLWTDLQQQFTAELDPHIRRLLYEAYQAEGIHEDIEDSVLTRLGVSTFIELLPTLKNLEEQGSIIRQDTAKGTRFLPSELFKPETLDPGSSV